MRALWLITLLISFQSLAQLNEDFSDGDFTNAPTWVGDTDKFIVANGELQLDDPVATDTAILTTPNSSINNIEWRMSVRLGFPNPSNNNYLKIYLVSNQQNLESPLNGYFLRMGETGANDAIELYRQDGYTETLVFRGIDKHAYESSGDVILTIKVLRNGSGNWQLFSDTTGGTNFQLENSGTDNTHTSTSHFGFYCRHTSSNADEFYFDDIYIGPEIFDTEPPTPLSVAVISATEIDIQFDESLLVSEAEKENNYFISNGIGNPSSATIDVGDPSLVHLVLVNNLNSGTNYDLIIDNVEDLENNAISSDTIPFSYFEATLFDVLINEIMAKPDNSISSMPDEEYLELYNNSPFTIDLTGWKLYDAAKISSGNPAILGAYSLPPDSFLILCNSGDEALFQPFGNVLGVSSWPSLNNDGDDLLITNENDDVIHFLSYDDSWYHDVIKSGGGFSLEIIDHQNPCAGESNWWVTLDPAGGTPGKINSVDDVNQDTEAPTLIRVNVIAPVLIQAVFSETLTPSIASDVTNFLIDQGIGNPVSAVPNPYDFTTVTLQLSNPVQTGQLYTLTAINLEDCAGNTVSTGNEAEFGIPETIEAGDLVINEVLFNPLSGGVDYVEIYNRSTKVLDLQNLRIVELDAEDTTSVLDDAVISSDNFLVLPGEYWVLAEEPNIVLDHYIAENPLNFIEIPDMPNYPDDAGIVQLRSLPIGVIDQLQYVDDWHFALISPDDGVSLERINYDQETQSRDNWHSAASVVGYGTPTYQNSQFGDGFVSSGQVTVDPEVFSPDQDGNKDFTSILYELDEPGLIGNVRIYDVQGRLIRDLVQNELLDSNGSFLWDGLDDEQNKARIGVYVVVFELFGSEGQTEIFRNRVVLGGKI